MIIFPLHSAFLGLPLEGDSKEAFQEAEGRLAKFGDILSFQNPQTPHLTLQFWKELMEIEFHQVIRQSERVAEVTEPFTLKIEGVDTFGKKGQTRVLFLSVPFSEPLARLKKRCPWPSLHPGDEQGFHPHVTLARVLHPQKFAVHEKEIMKLLRGISFTMNVNLLRLYGNIDGKPQTPIKDFSFLGIRD